MFENSRALTLAPMVGKESIRVGSKPLHSRRPFWARREGEMTRMRGWRRSTMTWDGAGEQRKRWPPTIRSSHARSFTYSLSSLVSILSPLCVLLIYRAAGKCLRHSPSIVQPISLLFFLLPPPSGRQQPLPIPFAIRLPSFLLSSFPLATVLHPSLPPLYRGSLIPFFIIPNILTNSDHRESLAHIE